MYIPRHTKSISHLRGVVIAVTGPTLLGPIRRANPMTAQVIPSHPLISGLSLEAIFELSAALQASQVLMSLRAVAFM